MRKSDPTRYSQRKQSAKEFNYLGRNEGNMRDVHGQASTLIRTLLVSICQQNRLRKRKSRAKHQQKNSKTRKRRMTTTTMMSKRSRMSTGVGMMARQKNQKKKSH